jgi:DNA (cytosine-5)-methyltransferase 1
MRAPKNGKPSFASIFSGCGGFDLGFIQAGFNSVGAFDIDPLVVEVHKKNLNSDAIVHDLSGGSLPAEAHLTPDVLISGSPCQGFSTAGKRNIDDPRNELLLTAGHIAKKVKPKVFIAENVAGVISGPHRKYWESLKVMLKEEGYKTTDIICEGLNAGVPQIRKRAVLLAWRNDRDVDVRIPIIPGGVLRTALSNLQNAPNHTVRRLLRNSNLALIAQKIKCGQKLSNVRGGSRSVHTWEIPEVFGKTTIRERELLETLMRIRRQRRVRDNGDADPVPFNVLESTMGSSVGKLLLSLETKGYVRRNRTLYDLAHTFNGKFKRLHLDQPSPTVDTRFGEPRYFLHPTQNRGFTVREAARIQGFPDNFIFDGPERSQFRMIGNAVPPPLAKCLATFIKQALL